MPDGECFVGEEEETVCELIGGGGGNGGSCPYEGSIPLGLPYGRVVGCGVEFVQPSGDDAGVSFGR